MAVPRALRTVSNLLFNPKVAIPDVEEGTVAAAKKARPALADLGTRTGAAVAAFQNPAASMVPPNASAGTTANYTGAPPIAAAAPISAAAAPVRTNYPITDPAVVRAQQPQPPAAAAPTAAPAAVPAAAPSPLQARTPTANAAPDGGTTAAAAPVTPAPLVSSVPTVEEARAKFDEDYRRENPDYADAADQKARVAKMGVMPAQQQMETRTASKPNASGNVASASLLPTDWDKVRSAELARRNSGTQDRKAIEEGVSAAQARQADFDARTAATAERFNLGVVRPSLVNSAAPGASRQAQAGLLAQDMAGRGYDTLGRRAAADSTANQASLIGAKGAAELAQEQERTTQKRVEGRSLVGAARVTGEAGVQRQTVESAGAVDVAKAAQNTASLQADQTRAAQVAERERAAVEKLSLRNETARRQSYDDLAAWTNRDKDEDDRTYAKRIPTVYAQLALMEASMIRSGLSVANPQGIRGLLKTVVLEDAPAEVQQALAARMMRGETINQIVASDSQLAQYVDRKKLQALPQF